MMMKVVLLAVVAILLVACVNAEKSQLNAALSAAVTQVDINTIYQKWFGVSIPTLPSCSSAFPSVQAGSDLDKVIKAKTIRLGYGSGGNAPWVIVNNTLTGFDVDVAAALAAALSTEYSVTITVTWVPQSTSSGFFAGLNDGLQAGSYDAIMSGVTITTERSAIVDFTCAYFPSSIGGLQTTRTSSTPFASYSALNASGLVIGYQTGTAGAPFAQALTQATFQTVSSYNDVANLVEAESVDFFVMSQAQAGYYVSSHSSTTATVSSFVIPGTESYMGIATKQVSDESSSASFVSGSMVVAGAVVQLLSMLM